MKLKSNDLTKQMFNFVILIGIVNFFADATYEGARSIIGPFMGTLGASATIIGFVSGFGEFLGFALRSISGFFADRTHSYWKFTFIGYAINVLAVPALALAGNWPLAAVLIILERVGRAIRKPSVEAMLSFTTKKIGHGWVFGVNEALDQAGATLGPLIVSLILYLKGGYNHAFAILLITALLCLTTIGVAWFFNKNPEEFEQTTPEENINFLTKDYLLYIIAGALIAAGFADFSLISFHFEQQHILAIEEIPLIYSLAMASAAISGLVLGKLFDKLGFAIFLSIFFICSFFAPFAFSQNIGFIIIGAILWGIGLGSQNTLFKAELSKIISAKRRGSAFGIFDTGFGLGWFIGSAIMGWVYDHSILAMLIFSISVQLCALPIFVVSYKLKN